MMTLQPREPKRSAYQRGYTKQWDARAKRFREIYYFCGMRPNSQPPVMSRCADLGLKEPATQTDHVVPHRGNQDLFWDEQGNWQALCASCGARKSQAGL
jgi:5-methylcytosine-specific restriction protein A